MEAQEMNDAISGDVPPAGILALTCLKAFQATEREARDGAASSRPSHGISALHDSLFSL
jgi:hypothetical protein